MVALQTGERVGSGCKCKCAVRVGHGVLLIADCVNKGYGCGVAIVLGEQGAFDGFAQGHWVVTSREAQGDICALGLNGFGVAQCPHPACQFAGTEALRGNHRTNAEGADAATVIKLVPRKGDNQLGCSCPQGLCGGANATVVDQRCAAGEKCYQWRIGLPHHRGGQLRRDRLRSRVKKMARQRRCLTAANAQAKK